MSSFLRTKVDTYNLIEQNRFNHNAVVQPLLTGKNLDNSIKFASRFFRFEINDFRFYRILSGFCLFVVVLLIGH